MWLVASGDRRVSVWNGNWKRDMCCLVDWLTFPGPPVAPNGTRLKKGDKVCVCACFVLCVCVCMLCANVCIHVCVVYCTFLFSFSSLSVISAIYHTLVFTSNSSVSV